MRTFKSFASLAILSAVALAQSTDTEEKPVRNIAGFTPSVVLAIVGIAAYGLAGAIHWIHFFRDRTQKYTLTLCIGMICMVMGFVLRIAYSSNVSSIGVYSIMTLFLLLPPCAFLAINYMILTRLANALGAESALFIKASRVVKLFLWSDVISFLALANGGGLSVIKSMAKIGHYSSIGGLVLQVVSYSFFCVLLITFGIRVPRKCPHVEQHIDRFSFSSFNPLSTSTLNDWRVLFKLMIISSIGISIRCVFRLIEFTQGYDGYLATHEAYFYLFDALPLLISMSLYAIFWPPRFIEGARSIGSYESLEPLHSLNRYPPGTIPVESSSDRTNYNKARYGDGKY
ncbi:hypothetical protein JCM3765_003398 [Sporobolomyces pararoseus]